MLTGVENEMREASASVSYFGLTVSEWIGVGIGLLLLALARGAMHHRNLSSFIATVTKEAKLFIRIAAGNRGNVETIGTTFVIGHRFPGQRWAWGKRAVRRFRRHPSEWLHVRHHRMVLITCEQAASVDVEALWDTGLSRREVVNRTLTMYPLPKRHYTEEELPDKVAGYPGRRQPATIIELRTGNDIHGYLFVEGHWWWQRARHPRAPEVPEATDG